MSSSPEKYFPQVNGVPIRLTVEDIEHFAKLAEEAAKQTLETPSGDDEADREYLRILTGHRACFDELLRRRGSDKEDGLLREQLNKEKRLYDLASQQYEEAHSRAVAAENTVQALIDELKERKNGS